MSASLWIQRHSDCHRLGVLGGEEADVSDGVWTVADGVCVVTQIV